MYFPQLIYFIQYQYNFNLSNNLPLGNNYLKLIFPVKYVSQNATKTKQNLVGMKLKIKGS